MCLKTLKNPTDFSNLPDRIVGWKVFYIDSDHKVYSPFRSHRWTSGINETSVSTPIKPWSEVYLGYHFFLNHEDACVFNACVFTNKFMIRPVVLAVEVWKKDLVAIGKFFCGIAENFHVMDFDAAVASRMRVLGYAPFLNSELIALFKKFESENTLWNRWFNKQRLRQTLKQLLDKDRECSQYIEHGRLGEHRASLAQTLTQVEKRLRRYPRLTKGL